MAMIGFDDASYIELIAPINQGVTAGSDWAKFMSEDAVTCAWAAGTNVLLQEVERLKKAGIPVTAPVRGNRKRPDGMSVEWMTADVGSGTPGSTLPFMIEDQTPRAWRVQTSASVQGSPVTGIENVVLGVNNLDAAIALLRKAYLLGTHDLAAAATKYKLSNGKPWFGQKVAWFDTNKLKGVRLGVIGQ
jgi:hypothetical protein